MNIADHFEGKLKAGEADVDNLMASKFAHDKRPAEYNASQSCVSAVGYINYG